ncbi:uncharacterized protein [Procambarus clarkii]|uniref:uncharacterized protein n=1 Tax=Procambarus clarkii TaxID=6728 RepID=UPI001E6746FA|nr:uncharacterized protein LOC123758189 [Procambarus clarkii]
MVDIPAPDGSTDSLQAFRLELESLLKELDNKVNLDESDWLIQFLMKHKLPSEILDKLCVLHTKSSLTVKEIMEGLRSVIERQRDNTDGKSTPKPSLTIHSRQKSTNSTQNISKATTSTPRWKQGNVDTYAVGPSKPTVNVSPETVTPQGAVNVWRPCLFCEEEHSMYNCKTYPDHATRVKRLQELHKCTRCLRSHNPDTCATQICTCNRCNKGQHHTALCGDSKTKSPKPQVEEGTSTSVQLCKALPDVSVLSTKSDSTHCPINP